MFKKKTKSLTEDELIEAEIDKEIPEISLFNIKEFINLLKSKTEEDLEYESLLTEEEKLEEKKEKKEVKILVIRSCCIVAAILIVIIGGMSLFFKANESELNAITKPLLKEYYKNNYSKNISFSGIEEICFVKNNQQMCEGLVLATTKDNEHIMAINNDFIGDDINTKVVTDLNNFVDNQLNTKMLIREIKYSYQDYYYNYNFKLPYINVLPNKSVEELINSQKVTIAYCGIYEGNIDINIFLNLLNNFSNDSKVYLIEENNSMPTKLTILSKNKIDEIEITGNRLLEEGIYSFEYNKLQNSIKSPKIIRYVDSKIIGYDNYKLSNIMEITFENNNYYNNEGLPIYYLFRIDTSMIKENNLLQVISYEDGYKEKDIEDYYNLMTISFGGHTYIIGSEKIIIASLTKNKSFLCNLGLC